MNMNEIQNFHLHIPITQECTINEDCSDRGDTCTLGECKCGENDKCTILEVCYLGNCVGKCLSISRKGCQIVFFD